MLNTVWLVTCAWAWVVLVLGGSDLVPPMDGPA